MKQINQLIYTVRNQKVMLDTDLAELYGIETKVFNQSIKRNISRFPDDFMFQLSNQEFRNLKSQIPTSSEDWGGRRSLPHVFTENGVAMLSSVLNSERAIQINIAIMRAFTQMRGFLQMKNSSGEVDQLKKDTEKIFTIVFERLENLEETVYPKLSPRRKKIGLK